MSFSAVTVARTTRWDGQRCQPRAVTLHNTSHHASKYRRAYSRNTRCCHRYNGLVHNISVSYLPELAFAETSPASAVLQGADADLQQCIALMAQCRSADPSASAATSRARAEQAFGVLYDQTVQRVHALVRRFVKDEATAQEVTEDIFFMAWSHAQRFDPSRGSALAWLLTMARSKALDAWRQQAARWVHSDSDLADEQLAKLTAPGGPSDILEATDQQQAVHAALQNVSPAARQMISLAFFQGLTHSEISTHLNVPLGTVKTTLRRALASMRAVLQERLGLHTLAGLSDPEQPGYEHE